jgi:HAE1 family hydrophobic/amphiphilic exporter-1
MLIGTILGVFVIPVLFIVFQTLQERISGPAKENYDDEGDDEEEVQLIEAHKE